jgi:hypothetical protein
MHIVFWLETQNGGDHLEDLGIDGNIILELMLVWEFVDWIHLD